MIARTVTLAVLLGLGTISAPADAQRRQRIVEVFGNDRCPEGNSDDRRAPLPPLNGNLGGQTSGEGWGGGDRS